MISIPGLERIPGGRNGNPLQYSCLENLMDKRAWQAIYSPWGCSQTRLSTCQLVRASSAVPVLYNRLWIFFFFNIVLVTVFEFFYFGTQDSEFCDLEGLCHIFFVAQFHLEFITAQSVESKSQGDLDFPFLSKPFRWQEPIVIFLQEQIQHDIEAKVAQQ